MRADLVGAWLEIQAYKCLFSFGALLAVFLGTAVLHWFIERERRKARGGL